MIDYKGLECEYADQPKKTSPCSGSRLGEIASNIDTLIENISYQAERAERIANNLLGSVPQEVEKSIKEHNPNSGIEVLQDGLARLHDRAERLSFALQRLEEL